MLGIIQTLATITIVIVAIKLLLLILVPKHLMKSAKFYTKYSKITAAICLIGAAIVFYYLLIAGISVVEILAVALFISLLSGFALAGYAAPMIKEIKPKTLLKENWLMVLIIVVLVLWGLKEIFLR